MNTSKSWRTSPFPFVFKSQYIGIVCKTFCYIGRIKVRNYSIEPHNYLFDIVVLKLSKYLQVPIPVVFAVISGLAGAFEVICNITTTIPFYFHYSERELPLFFQARRECYFVEDYYLIQTICENSK